MNLAAKLTIAIFVPVVSLIADISITPQYEEIPERGKVLQYKIESGKAEFYLNPPATWQFELSAAENRLTFRNEQISAVFSIQLRENSPPASARELQQLVEQRFPNAQTFEPFSCVGRDGQGLGMVTRFPAADGSLFENRLAFLSYGSETFELSLTAPASAIARAYSAWIAIVNSLHQKPVSP